MLYFLEKVQKKLKALKILNIVLNTISFTTFITHYRLPIVYILILYWAKITELVHKKVLYLDIFLADISEQSMITLSLGKIYI